MEGDVEAYEGFHGIKTFFSRREEIGNCRYDTEVQTVGLGYRRFQDARTNAKKKLLNCEKIPVSRTSEPPYLA